MVSRVNLNLKEGLVNAAYNNSCLDVLATNLMACATAQIGILNEKIVNFKNRKSNVEDSTQGDMYDSNLDECIIHHNEIIRYIQNLEQLFSIIFLVQYISSGIVICNIGFQLVHVRE
ncbi:hypothetical protein NQ318_016476 [Aromia moschata]|uniref:Uncharacterized protein n=1 Tax=Aromia moschata TaxID=1265417 RepID=A0AAV8Z5Q8_9CUCU|nr:hypothetical protein NQ318_016476 [Aromia moschata]